jgi:hypothetical protein
MILNPWKALRELQAELELTKENLSIMDSEYGGMRILWEEAKLRNRLADAHIERLTEQLDQAHFRDPKTGRIGPRGRRFS